MSKKKMLLTQLVFVVIIISCASSIPLKPQDKASLQTISISNHVEKPDVIYYKEYSLYAPHTTSGRIEAYNEMKNANQIIYLMKHFDIDVSQIVREQFTNELESSGIFNSILPEGADGEIKLRVLTYGFGPPILSEHRVKPLKPMMGIEGRLQTSDGSVVWKKYAYVTNLSKITPEYSPEDFTNKPESLRRAFEITAAIIVQELVSHMKGEK